MVLSSVNHFTLTATIATLRVSHEGAVTRCRGRLTVEEPGNEPPRWPLAFESRGKVAERLSGCGFGDAIWAEGRLAYITWLHPDGTERHGYVLVIEQFQLLMRRETR